VSRPLLVIDGDSFAHRAYHGLPKSIRRAGNRGGGAIVGFANFLLRLYESERPRGVLVGWDTLDVPTYRHRAFAPYQPGFPF
jgi:DNA polymerase-1